MTILLEQIVVKAPTDPDFEQLRQVSSEFNKGSMTLIAGPAGAGKSTLLDVIAGLRLPDQGHIYYNGISIWNKNKPASVDMRIAMVFQQPEQQLFARTVRAEFVYSLKRLSLTKEAAEARIHKAMKAVQLPLELLESNPFALSGGQKRRVAIATTLALEPDWLVLDEPSASLDPEATSLLTDYLASFVKDGGGVIVASHDLDTFLPLADRIMLVHEGVVTADVSQEELCRNPALLRQAGLALPDALLAAESLRKCGYALPHRLLQPEELAAALLPQLQASAASASAASQRLGAAGAAASGCEPAPASSAAASLSAPPSARVRRAAGAARSLGLAAADPRALWGCYMLLSISILTQQSILGLLASGAATAAVIAMSRVHVRSFWRSVRPFLWMMLFTTAISGLQVSWEGGFHAWFSVSAAGATLSNLTMLLLVLVLGILLPLITSTIRMKRGLEQGLRTLNKLKIPVEAFALAASLLFRFVPLILSELERFSRIARSRGKSRARPGYLRLSDLPAVMIPLLGSLIQTAEQFASAMELRGYTRIGQARTYRTELYMTGRDYRILLFCALLCAVLVIIDRL